MKVNRKTKNKNHRSSSIEHLSSIKKKAIPSRRLKKEKTQSSEDDSVENEDDYFLEDEE
jgi:hypothetical protein